MIEFYVTGQKIRYASPVIAANSINYLEACFHFSEDWDSCSKWAHFKQGETVYDLNLVEDKISTEMGLNLGIGQWEVYVTGSKENGRLTTVPVIMRVMESGLVDEPLHAIPMSVAEQVDAKASTALLMAQSVKDKADRGEFNGKAFEIKGYFGTAAELEAAITEPDAGDIYGVGSAVPYDLYVWDRVNSVWVNNGGIQGAKGEKGDAGVTFIPGVAENGNLSWTNNGGLDNPQTVNIKGTKGDKGDKGSDGKSPYQAAVDEGYTGTAATFNAALTMFPYHNARHLPDGADPIRVKTGNIDDGAVTESKLSDSARKAGRLVFTGVSVSSTAFADDSTYADFPQKAAITLSGVNASLIPEVIFSGKDAMSGNFAPVTQTYDGGVYIYAAKAPENGVTIPTIICWR